MHSAPSNRVSLKRRVLGAGTWSIGGYALNQALRLGSNLVMTRLLVPDMFGVMAIANIVMTGLALFSDLGLKQNIVQSGRGNDPTFLNTAWVIQIVRGVLLWFVALCIGVLVVVFDHFGLVPKDSVFADPRLPYVIAASSFIAVIAGTQSTKLFEASRNLSLGRITLIDITALIVGLLCMLAWVSIDRSIWALVSGGICSALTRAILSHAWLPGTANRWHWDNSAFAEIFHFGKWIFLASILGFLVNSGDRLLLGSLINAHMLGVYVIAYIIFSSIDQLLSKVIGDVSFPALSEVARERRADLKRAYYRFRLVLGTFINFCAGFLMVSGHALIALLYDQRYAQAGWMLEILAVCLLATPFRVAIYSFIALGAPKLLSQISSIRCIALFGFTLLGFKFAGLQGAIWGIVLSYFSAFPVTIFHKLKYGLFDFRTELMMLPAIPIGILAGKVFNSLGGF